jgi:hypothetical protein
MTLMFGNKKKKEQALADEEAVKAELHRLESLPIEAVAAEVMTRTFSPSGPTVDGEIRANAIADGFLPDSIRRQIYRLKDEPVAGLGFPEYWQLKALVREGLQVLVTKGLVVFEPSDHFPKYRATRLGVDAIEHGAVDGAIREAPIA